MKAKDLMVGDIVALFGDKYAKVDCIGNVEVYLTDYVNECNWQTTYEHIKPIPLTPEILEKNGWALWEIEGEYRQKDAFAIYGRKAPFTVFDGIEINYVHELQHALRLCRIEKEIVV